MLPMWFWRMGGDMNGAVLHIKVGAAMGWMQGGAGWARRHTAAAERCLHVAGNDTNTMVGRLACSVQQP